MKLLCKVGILYQRINTRTSPLVHGAVRCLSSKHYDHIIRSPAADIPIPSDVSLSGLILSRAQQFTDRLAMVDAASGAEHTYKDLAANMERVASALRSRGLQKNDVVCIYACNSTDFVYMMMGTIHAGGIATTVNPSYTTGELLYQLNDSQAKFFACSAAGAQVSTAACDQYGKIQERFVFGDALGFTSFSKLIEEEHSTFIPEPVNAKEDLAILPYSSGTTGRAKGVMLTHYNMVANLHQVNLPQYDVDRPGVQETYLCVLPLFHIYGIYALMLYSFLKGNTMVVMASFDTHIYLSTIQTYKVTMLHIVPPIAIALTRHQDLAAYDLSSVHTAMSAAAPMGKELQQELMQALNIPTVKQGYGLTETSPLVTVSAQTATHGSAGIVLANTQCMIVDTGSGKSLPAGETGELWVRGPQVMKGYLNRPDATAETIDADGWLHTGDLAYYDDQNNFFIVDRLKELIKYKGLQIAPAELEALLITHPSIADVAVIGVPDEAAGEVPKAFVVPKPNASLTEDHVKEFVKENLAPYKQLRGGVEFMEAIPKSPSGKILRRLLREAGK